MRSHPEREAEATLEDAPRPPVQTKSASKTANQGAERFPSVQKAACGGLFRIVSGFTQSDPHQQSSNDTPAHIKTTLWGQLGEILGGVRFP